MAERFAQEMFQLDWEHISHKIEQFIVDQTEKLGRQGVVVGISGGLDSAVVSLLSARALGPKKVKGVFIPERDTSPESNEHARELAEAGGFSLKTIDITRPLEHLGCYRGAVANFTRYKSVNRFAYWLIQNVFHGDPYRTTIEGTDSRILRKAIASYRLKHRLRMAVLYQQAEQRGMSVAGCLNLTELLTGFFVPYGDSASDFSPILDLFKSQVSRLAHHIGVPESIIQKVPTPDLLPGIVDETALGISYDKLDQLLYALEVGTAPQEVSDETGIQLEAVNRMNGFIEKSRRLREPVPYPSLRNRG